jgi:hypothetical protein
MRRANLAIVCAAAASLGGLLASAPASAAAAGTGMSTFARYAAQASAYQNTTIAQALQRQPSGQRVSPSEVAWNGGSVIMAVPAAPFDSSPPCPSSFFTHWTCVYNQTNWNGTQLQFKDQGYYQDLYAYGGSGWRTYSYDNELRQRTWLNQYESHTHSGISLCMSPQAISADSAGPWSADRWIYLSTNGNPC